MTAAGKMLGVSQLPMTRFMRSLLLQAKGKHG